MRKTKFAVYAFLLSLIISFAPSANASLQTGSLKAEAHGGKTDKHGGHKDNKNKSGLGSYHYHCDGREAHLHPDGVCPYSSTQAKSSSASSASNSNAAAKKSNAGSNAASNSTVKSTASSDTANAKTATVSKTASPKVTVKTDYDNLVFSAQYYYDHNADLQKAIGNDAKALYKHFCSDGMKEGRQGISTFNVYTYKKNNDDLAEAFGDDLPKYYQHYLKNGCKENRVCH